MENQTDIDSLEPAKDSIDYALKRVRDDENIRYHMGAFTEAFERLKAAHSAINGISPECIEKDVFGKELRRKPAAKILEEIKDIVQGCPVDDSADAMSKIAALLST